MYDQNGELCIVSFNMASPINDSTDAILEAKEDAGSWALGNIRDFLGEQLVRSKDVFRSETIKDFEDNTRDYSSQSGAKEVFKSFANSLPVQGLQTVLDWSGNHPLTKHAVCGAVAVWKPSSRDFANYLGQAMVGAGRSAAGKPSGPNAPAVRSPINSDQNGAHQGQGVKGDRDGF